MSWVDDIKDSIPDHAKDIRLNLDAVINRSGLSEVDAHACALAAAIASGYSSYHFADMINHKLLSAGHVLIQDLLYFQAHESIHSHHVIQIFLLYTGR